MTANPFTAFAFDASGSNQVARTLPARLSDIHSVRDFGAVGDGVHDDWAAIMACYNWKTFFITTSASNLVASFTGVIASATFTGTISGNTLTTSSPTGTIAIGQTISGAGVTSCRITSGSGTSWVVNGSSQSVGPVAMASNCVLTATGGTSASIAVGDWLLNNGGTDASPSTINSGTQIASSVGGGIFVLNSSQNFTSQAMMTVSATVSLTSSLDTLGLDGYDANNATVAGNGISANTAFNRTVGATAVFQFMGGLVNSGDSIGFQSDTRGIIYFPPGNYSVSQQIDFTAGNAAVLWIGELGLSTITGSFPGFVLQQSAAEGVLSGVQKLNIVNTHPTGGGIRLGGTNVGAVRDCTITANRGISDYDIDGKQGGAYFGSFEITIENCVLSPGSNVTGSQGIARQSDGPVTNCRLIGYETGFMSSGGEGCQNLIGCYFEKCSNAVLLNQGPDGGSFSCSGVVIAGCWFKNNSIAINIPASTSLATLIGIRIEGTNGQAPGGANPQYGIFTGGGGNTGNLSQSLVAGITVAGQFDNSGIYVAGHNFFINGPTFMGAADASTCPNPFDLDPFNGNVYLPTQIACSARHIYTVAALPAGNDNGQQINVSDGTNSLAWGAPVIGTGTHATHYLGQWNGSSWTVMGQ